MIRQLLSLALIGLSGIGFSPAFAASRPIRWTTGGAVWSTPQERVDAFVDRDTIEDRGLEDGVAGSGWSREAVRSGLSRAYTVDLRAVCRFLYSTAGIEFLKTATNNYAPYWGQSSTSVQALRSPILRDAEDGSISALGIMRGLPTDFRLFQGPQVVAEEPTCKPDSARCTSLLSWYLGLPGRIQTRQRPDPFLDR